MAKKTAKGPAPHFKKRLQTLRRRLVREGADALLVTNRHDHIYLAGFTGEDSALLVTAREAHIISDGRFETSISHEAAWAPVTFRRNQLLDTVAEVVKEKGVKKLGVQSEYMSVSERAALAKVAGRVKLVEGDNWVGERREIKDDCEVDQIRASLKVCEAAYRAMLKTIKVGQTELELAARLEYEMKRRGSLSPAFDSIVAINENAALPHAFPGTRKVKKGCLILFDWGATLDFYRSDLTRTVFVGSIPPHLGEVYEVVLEAQMRAIKAIRPGKRMCDIDAVARDYIAEKGYGDYFGHGLGHGLGLDTHEAPSLSWRSSAKLKQGMVVTVEPGIYLPGEGGVRIEDDVLVTKDGCEVLSKLPKTLRSSVLSI